MATHGRQPEAPGGDQSRRADHAGAAARAVDERIERASRSNCTLLLTGETGVGKGYLAKRIHRISPRREGPFIPVNCGAIPESLIDSQLFGHVKGAFSGATHDHIGVVRAAEKGTLLLDEVGELPSSAQTRLLRLLQDQEVQPVGQARPIVVDVRIIAATNDDLRAAVRQARFREDLLFRLDVVRIDIRPLRERPDEVHDLLARFNREFAELYRQSEQVFDEAALDHLRRYRWPGNIRELRTVVERLHVLCPGERVTLERLVEIGHAGDPGLLLASPQLRRSARQLPFDEVRRVLADNDGSVARTAAVLGVHRSTIYRWLQSHGAAAGRESR